MTAGLVRRCARPALRPLGLRRVRRGGWHVHAPRSLNTPCTWCCRDVCCGCVWERCGQWGNATGRCAVNCGSRLGQRVSVTSDGGRSKLRHRGSRVLCGHGKTMRQCRGEGARRTARHVAVDFHAEPERPPSLKETQRGRLWTACGQRCVDSKNSQTTPATTSTSSIRQLLGAADTQTAHHATFSTVPTHQLGGTGPTREPRMLRSQESIRAGSQKAA